MNTRTLNLIRFLLIVAIVVAAAATPSLADAKPAKKAAASKSTKATRKSSRKAKKMKLDFSSPAPEQSSSVGPRLQARTENVAGETVYLRGGSMDDLWTQNTSHKKTSVVKKPVAVKVAAAKAPVKPAAVKLAAAKLPAKVESKKPVVVAAAPQPILHSPKDLDFEDATPEARERENARRFVKPVAQSKLPPREAPARPYVSNQTVLQTAKPSSFKFDLALENTVSLGRTFELEEAGGRNYSMKNELILGATEAGGWGLRLTGAFNSTSNADSSKDVREIGDPTVIVAHPSLYKNESVDVYGRFRYYAPVSTASREVGLHHFAYYLFADMAFPSKMALTNLFLPRYFSQAEYKDTDAYMLVYDATELTAQVNSYFRVGIGQQTQIESHHATDPGTTVEAYPFVDFIGVKNVLLQAKYYLPVYVKNTVGGAPLSAGISNAQAEFFAKISF